jgi:hypothetical protein
MRLIELLDSMLRSIVIAPYYKNGTNMIERLLAEMKALLEARQEEIIAKMDSFQEEIKASTEEMKAWRKRRRPAGKRRGPI